MIYPVAGLRAQPDDRGLERFFINVNGGLLIPYHSNHENDNMYYNLSSGSTFIAKGGWRYLLNERGGLGLNIAYSASHAVNEPQTKYANSYYYSFGNYPFSSVYNEVSISRWDISLIDAFLVMGAKKESYFHVAINLIFNRNIFKFNQGYLVVQGNQLTNETTYRPATETGFGGEMGFHISVSNHFGITLDGGFAIPGYKKQTNYFSMPGGGTFVTNTSKSSGMYFYSTLGIMYGIW